MDVNTITSLIGTLGFPIVCCIVMFRQNSELTKSLQEQNDKLTKAITDMSITMEKMRLKLDMLVKGGTENVQ